MQTRDIVLMASFAALIAVFGLLPPITIGILPVPITLQTLGVMLAGLILGPMRAAGACLLLLALAAAGLPILSGGRGGLAAFAGPTAGFLFMFPVGAFVTGFISYRARSWTGPLRWIGFFAACCIGGILMVYAGGIPWLAIVGGLGFETATIGSIVFIPGDLIKAVLATGAAISVERAYPSLWERV